MMQSTQAPVPPDLLQALRLSNEYRQSGRLPQAEDVLRSVLSRYPNHPLILAQLGELLMLRGAFDAALPLLQHARQISPANAPAWLMETQCLLALDRHKDAKKVISEAIRQGMRHPLADQLLERARSGKKGKSESAVVPLKDAVQRLDELLQTRRYAEVEQLAGVSLRRHAKSPQLWYLLGMAVLMQGRKEAALQPLRRSVELEPGNVPALYNLGFALDELDRPKEALEAYRKTVKAAPQLAEAHNNMGNVLQQLKRHDEALVAYERAIALKPRFAPFCMNRGDALRDLGRLEEAAAAYREAVAIQPDLVEASISLAYTLTLLQGHEEAVEVLQHVIKCRPEATEFYVKLAKVLQFLGRYEEALSALDKALKINPELDSAINLRSGILLELGRHKEALDSYRQGLALEPDGLFAMHSNFLLALNYQAGASSDALLAEARTFGAKAARRASPCVRHDNLPDPERRLRIGLISGDLGEHPVGFFLRGVIENLNPDRLELFAYASAERSDALNGRFQQLIPNWRDAKLKLEDDALASLIRADEIDILIDLAGHTGKTRLPVFAWKPAPVQVAWLGYFATTGLDAMDYILADRWVLPHEEEGNFVERPWRLPDAYYCFSPPDIALEVGSLPALREGQITFGCFNNLTKVNDRVIACWARVLDAVPGSRLMLKTKVFDDASVVADYCARFVRCGVAPERLIFEGASPRADYLAAYNKVDIALDPFPFPGGTTSVEGLWMGVPVLTLKGDRFISHQGETILNNVGLPQWIAADEYEYVAKAAAFASNLPALAVLRAGLRERLLASPLCDAPRFARNLEEALRGMWRIWCERHKAA